MKNYIGIGCGNDNTHYVMWNGERLPIYIDIGIQESYEEVEGADMAMSGYIDVEW